MRALKKWWLVIVVMLVIFGFSSLPGDTVDSLGLAKESYHIDGHFLLFLLLGFSLFRATRSYSCSLMIGIVYGITDEVHQLFVPRRSAGVFDILVDSIGVIVSLLVIWLTLRLRAQKNLLKK